MTLPSRPYLGTPESHSRAWVKYRAQVREIAARWCDNPTKIPDPKCPDIVDEWSCDACDACRARELVLEGKA